MKSFLFFPVLAIFAFSHQTLSHFNPDIKIDTVVINHVQDGLVSEWPDSIFQTDKGTNILYAADNDARNLYVAMKIHDFRMQGKLMRLGMNFYIDMKGKKKENRGIEFPIKRESEGGFSGGGFNGQQNQQGNNGSGGFDKKAMRARYALYMLSIKLFGFIDDDPVAQELQKEGSVNVAYSWDSTDVMFIEYLIPLTMLGDAASLNNKTISIGWKINGVEMPTASPTSSTTTVTSRPSGGSFRGGGSGRNVGSSPGPSQADMDKMMQEQSFWMKYVFH